MGSATLKGEGKSQTEGLLHRRAKASPIPRDLLHRRAKASPTTDQRHRMHLGGRRVTRVGKARTDDDSDASVRRRCSFASTASGDQTLNLSPIPKTYRTL